MHEVGDRIGMDGGERPQGSDEETEMIGGKERRSVSNASDAQQSSQEQEEGEGGKKMNDDIGEVVLGNGAGKFEKMVVDGEGEERYDAFIPELCLAELLQ